MDADTRTKIKQWIMNRNEIIILVGVFCTSAAIWLMSDFADALIFFGLFAILYGVVKAIHDEWMNSW